jgi:tetratricopeptide (TPR) repeat protein
MLRKLTLIVFLFAVCFSFAKQNEEASSDVEIIKSVVISETTNWANRDFKGWADAWAHQDYILAMYPTDLPQMEFVGWDSLSSFWKSFYENHTEPLNMDIVRSNWNVRLYENAAWVSYMQKLISRENGEKLAQSREVKFLEKINGVWKIVYSTAVYQPSEEEETMQYNLNDIGYKLLNQGKFQEALAVFQLNVKFYPESWNVYDSIGEAYVKTGDKELAIENYQKSLQINPDNNNAVEMLKQLKK